MYKYAALLIFPISLLFLSGFNFPAKNYKNHSASVNPTKTPTPDSPVEIESVSFDKNTIYTWCPSAEIFPDSACTKDGMKIKVNTVARSAKNERLTYYYTVSGGQINGTGASVVWDLVGARPGEYKITVGISSAKRVSDKTVMKAVELIDCPACNPPGDPCICPNFSVLSPTKSVKADDSIVFEAKVEGGSQESVTYNWTISGGTIIEGQGTPKIKVKTDDETAASSVKATCEIGGEGMCPQCAREASETVTVTDK